MDFTKNAKAFLRDLPLTKMTGHQKFLAVAALVANGKVDVEVSTSQVKTHWRKSVLGVEYNPAFYDRAQSEGWVDSVASKKGILRVTDGGLENLAALVPDITPGDLKKSGSLVIVNRKATHTFDKFLRQSLAASKTQVLIADSWVDDTIFDTVLDVIPPTNKIKLIFAQDRGTFDARAKRFGQQYPNFAAKRYKHLHDRFMIVDDVGYILGPSIKDAASNSPALVVVLAQKEKSLLQSFFNDLWAAAKGV
ncbi:MAG TPA: hypothetical protein VMT53_07630 [Terriglobales bacterium]|nr:hypothetical protein [Terriglobales bacterium]